VYVLGYFFNKLTFMGGWNVLFFYGRYFTPSSL
jgi:hypothetical protein